jgi:Fe-S-cluster-containing hydrogenase component 2
MQKILVVDLDLCTGCGLCELACSFKKTGEFSRTNSRIKIFVWPKTAECVPVLCYQCDPAPCMNACGVPGAMKRDLNSSAIVIDSTKCIRCKVCLAVCPYGGIGLSANGEVIKCDYCGGEPMCAIVCPTKAIKWTTPDVASNLIKLAFAEKIKTESKGPAGPKRP